MSRKIFIGNLPYAFTSQDVSSLFSPFGEVVSAKVILDHATGRSRGFGFVEMSSPEAGKAAIDQLNGTDVSGRALTVREATSRGPGPGAGPGRPPRGPMPMGRRFDNSRPRFKND